MEKIIGMVLAVLLIVGAVLPYYGWALATLWQWYAVPLGAPYIGWAQFVGLALFLSVARQRTAVVRRNKATSQELVGFLCWPAIAVAIGFLMRGFM